MRTKKSLVPTMSKSHDAVRREEGVVTQILPNGLYALAMSDRRRVVAHISPDMRMHSTRLLKNSRVTVEISPFDPSRGRIVRLLGGVTRR